MRFGLFLFVTLCISAQNLAQPTWLTQETFAPITTSLHNNYQDQLLLGTDAGLYKKSSFGWELTQVNGFIHGIFSDSNWGTWVSSSTGLWQSYDCLTWQLVQTPFSATVRDIIYADTCMVVATADHGSTNGIGTYEGEGLFSLNLQGVWQERNLGITGSLSIWEIEETGFGWLAISADDQIKSGLAGLYKSNNQGLSWELLQVFYQEQTSQALFPLQITYPMDLLECPDGTYFSVEGKLGTIPAFFGAQMAMNNDTVLLKAFSLIPTSLPYQSSHPTTLQWKQDHLFASRLSIGLNYINHQTQSFSSLNQGFTPAYFVSGQPRFMPVLVEENTSNELYAIQFGEHSIYKLSQGIGLPNAPVTTTKGDIVCYPNPSSGKLKIESEKNIVQIRVVSTNGQEVLRKSYAAGEVIHLPFPSGLYFLILEDQDGRVYNSKVLVSKP